MLIPTISLKMKIGIVGHHLLLNDVMIHYRNYLRLKDYMRESKLQSIWEGLCITMPCPRHSVMWRMGKSKKRWVLELNCQMMIMCTLCI